MIPSQAVIQRSNLTILIPSSLTSETRDERIRAYKVGQIARAASVFRVSNIIIYRDSQFDDSRYIDLLLRYAETPQYLRKHLFPLQKELKYAGILPPLRTPHHPTASKSSDLTDGEFRVGVVVPRPKKSETKVGTDTVTWVDIGVDSPVPLKPSLSKVRMGERVNVRIFSRRPIQVELVETDNIPVYWGYRTAIEDSLAGVLDGISGQDALILATSREGRVLDTPFLEELGRQARLKSYTVVVFGSPKQGVESILAREGTDLSKYQCETLNTVPGQGTATVRTEEAVWATLSMLNLVGTRVKAVINRD